MWLQLQRQAQQRWLLGWLQRPPQSQLRWDGFAGCAERRAASGTPPCWGVGGASQLGTPGLLVRVGHLWVCVCACGGSGYWHFLGACDVGPGGGEPGLLALGLACSSQSAEPRVPGGQAHHCALSRWKGA